MSKLSLQNAFNSYFHNKYTFDDFSNLNVEFEYKEIFYSKNTYSPSKKLKRYQRFLNLFLFDLMDVNENVVFSYRKGVNAYDAIYPHRKSKYIFTTDIKAFFLHIDINHIRELILKNKKNFLIKKKEIVENIDTIVNLVTYNGILPIGAPSSPKISNAYLYDLDGKIEKYCHENEIIYTRYSDDFIFSSNEKESFDRLELFIKSELKNLGFDKFTLNEKKTRIHKQGNRVVLLGLVITPSGHITVDKNIKKNIEVLLHFYVTDKDKFKDFLKKNYDSNLEKISGILSHIKSIDSNFISKLKNKYGSFIVNSFIHRDIVDE